MSKKFKDIRWFALRLALVVVPLTLLFLFVYSSFVHVLKNQAYERLNAEQEKGTTIISSLIESTFSQYLSDLQLIFNSNEFSNYVNNPDAANLEATTQVFVRIAERRASIRQIRFIGKGGKEIIRVNNYGNDPVIVESADLQDKSNRDYYSALRAMAPGNVFISNMDLNVENNEIIVPYEPIMRLGFPVFRGNERIGMLMVNFDGYDILSFFSAYQSSLLKNLSFGLVDTNGSWVVNNEEYVFGSKFENTTANNLFSQEPDIREALTQTTQGNLRLEGTIYAYHAITPVSHSAIEWYPGGDRLWTVVSYFNDSEVAALDQNFLLQNPQIEWVLAFLILFAGFFILLALHQRIKDREEQKVSSLISNYAYDGIIVTDKDRIITFCNKAFETLSGYSKQDIIGKTPFIFSSAGQTTIIKIGEGDPVDTEKRLVWDKDRYGNFFLTYLAITEIQDYKGKPEHYVGVYTQFKVNSCLIPASNSPKFSMLPAPSLYVQEAIAKQKPLYCVFMQISNFEEYEIHFKQGKQYAFAAFFAQWLAEKTACKNPVSIYAPNTYFLLFTDCPTDTAMKERMKLLLSDFSKPIEFEGEQMNLIPICGISKYQTGEIKPNELLENACLAKEMLENAKTPSFRFFEQELYTSHLRRQSISKALPKAFANHEFILYYQPQIDIDSNAIVGAEALIRWNSPELGFLSPEDMLPVIEKDGYFPMLSDFVINTSIQFLARNKSLFEQNGVPFLLALNLTADDISNGQTIDTIARVLEQNRVNPEMLEVELTETNAVKSFLATESNLQRLKALGIRIAMDDFGTGYSSLSYLLELSMDKIKIDRAFIKDYPNIESVNIIKAIIGMAQKIRMTVLVEGVETEEQLAFLKTLGCDEYQGFFYSKPVKESDFIELYRNQRNTQQTISS
jgi:PAS domain S-box-containing protein